MKIEEDEGNITMDQSMGGVIAKSANANFIP